MSGRPRSRLVREGHRDDRVGGLRAGERWPVDRHYFLQSVPTRPLSSLVG